MGYSEKSSNCFFYNCCWNSVSSPEVPIQTIFSRQPQQFFIVQAIILGTDIIIISLREKWNTEALIRENQ